MLTLPGPYPLLSKLLIFFIFYLFCFNMARYMLNTTKYALKITKKHQKRSQFYTKTLSTFSDRPPPPPPFWFCHFFEINNFHIKEIFIHQGGGGGVSRFLIFSDKGGREGFSIFWPIWLSLQIMQKCQDLYCFSLNRTIFTIFFSLNLYFSYFFSLSICVNDFHIPSSSLKEYIPLKEG